MIHFIRRDALSTLDAFPPLEEYPESMRAQIAALRISRRRRKIASRTIAAVFYGVTFCALIFAAWIIAMATDRAIPTLTTVEITTPTVTPGADLDMRVMPHRLRPCEDKVIFRAYDRMGNIVNMSETGWYFPFGPLGIDRAFNRHIRISRDAIASRRLPDGRLAHDASLRIERQFFCNVVQKLLDWPIVENTRELNFTIEDPSR